MWTVLRGRRLGGWKFTRQHSVGSYVVDFYCAAGRLVIELDGPVHDRRREDDAERDGFLRAAGLRVLRFANPDIIGRPDHVRRTILDLLGGECPVPRTPLPLSATTPCPPLRRPPCPPSARGEDEVGGEPRVNPSAG